LGEGCFGKAEEGAAALAGRSFYTDGKTLLISPLVRPLGVSIGLVIFPFIIFRRCPRTEVIISAFGEPGS
jgi:hypothetical protein